MKGKYFNYTIVAIALSILTLTSCKKATTASAADSSVSAQDVSAVTTGVNTSSDDAAAAAGQVKNFSGKTDGGPWWTVTGFPTILCGATTVDSGTAADHTIRITYDGTSNCNGIIRNGTITIQNTNGIKWDSIGAELTISYDNLQVTDVESNNTYKINGTHKITNERGGLAWKVVAGLSSGPVSHRNTSSNMSITFPDGSQRTWTVDRTRTWTASTSLSNPTVTVSIKSEASGNVSETGTNRFGETFTNTIISPVSANSNCAYRPYTGEIQHQVNNKTVTVLFGTNPSGTALNDPAYCGSYGTYGFYITYSNGTRTIPRFVSYWR
jgi:hypothetical protein